jgi:hypothetical protein
MIWQIMHPRDHIGSRGEYLAFVLPTRFHGREQPYFRPYFLGEKAEALDFFVELVGAGERTPFFFAQVRTTRSGYVETGRRRRLRVSATRDEIARLSARLAPTYVIGIDELGETGYIISACQAKLAPVTSLPTDFALDAQTLDRLWNEVKGYWEAQAPSPIQSVFVA